MPTDTLRKDGSWEEFEPLIEEALDEIAGEILNPPDGPQVEPVRWRELDTVQTCIQRVRERFGSHGATGAKDVVEKFMRTIYTKGWSLYPAVQAEAGQEGETDRVACLAMRGGKVLRVVVHERSADNLGVAIMHAFHEYLAVLKQRSITLNIADEAEREAERSSGRG